MKKKTGKQKGKRFVIQKHLASHEHFDFRLEIEGILKSWAIPKIIPSKPGEKRLAVEVEDHPLEYIDFEGIIPDGNYGAGKVEIWDTGTYEIIEKTDKKIIFNLNGKKTKGSYYLIKLKDNNWLLIKGKNK